MMNEGLRLNGGPIYVVAFVEWDGNVTPFTKSVADTTTENGSYLFVPLFTNRALGEAFAKDYNESLSTDVYRVFSINYPYDVLKILKGLSQRYLEFVGFDPTFANRGNTVYGINYLHDFILGSI